ncbi:MAG TPA: DUF1697 domain-containing protein [Acidimicrobiales bacterium]|nr:DUF1697 domain-containing protein [Acidimicrobiales bacterium]
MARTRYVALLRGINVGGKNKVAMADLREAVEGDGHTDVTTYIASGNVLFTSDAPARTLEDRLEAALEAKLRLPLVVVVRSHRQLRDVVQKAPKGFGTQPGKFHSDVVFLKAPLTGRQAVRLVDPREGVDEVHGGTGVLYMSRLSARLPQSRLNRIAAIPEYKQMTIRSWNTATKLLELLEG